jgi:archaellum component FlaF (FlaF/FlaG flagellin family)
MRKALVIGLIVLFFALSILLRLAPAQVPITVWGYVYMPDGSPASGASVTVSGGGASASTTTDSSGKYQVDLTVPSVPVTVTVTASKGSYRGSVTKSGVEGVVRIDVTLQPPPPPPPPPRKSTSLLLSTDKSEYVLGENVTLKGRLTPGMSVQITMTIVSPNSSTFRVNLQSNGSGIFSYTFKPDRIGTWSAYAEYPGSSEYEASRSDTVSFRVKQQASLSMLARVSQPGTVAISGSLKPAAAGAAIMLYISLDGGKTWMFLGNTTTNETGQFTTSLELRVSGLVLFKAVFPGSDLLTKAETVQPPAIKLESSEEISLRQSLMACESNRSSLMDSLKRLNATNAALRDNIKFLEEKVKDLESRRKELEDALDNLSSENKGLQGTLRNYVTIIAVAVPVTFVLGLAIGLLLGKRGKIKRPGIS